DARGASAPPISLQRRGRESRSGGRRRGQRRRRPGFRGYLFSPGSYSVERGLAEERVMRRRGHRVIQWATGSVGRHAIPAIAEDPALELVGVWVHSRAKVGKDAGELAGIGPLGVRATDDVEALLRL